MRKIVNYTIATRGDERYSLSDDVNLLIKEGYQPFGSLSSFGQAMVKYEEAPIPSSIAGVWHPIDTAKCNGSEKVLVRIKKSQDIVYAWITEGNIEHAKQTCTHWAEIIPPEDVK